jgi:5'-nucleotidase/UDP-sugar diphosphatase
MIQTKEVTILYTNDFHAQEQPVKATWVEGSPMMGGAAYMASYIKKVRAAEPNVVLLDAGDIITGSPTSMLTEGKAPVDLFNLIGYDAVAIGNHEFDHGWRNAKKLIYQANFPFLAANIFYKGTNICFAKPYEIIEANDVLIGVIGIHGKKAGYETISLEQIEELEFRNQESILQEYVNLLRPHVDLIVVLAHQGIPAEQATEDREVIVERDFEEDVYIANQVKGIDVLIAGHCHKSIVEPYVAKQTGTLVVSTRALGTIVGYLKLKINDQTGKIVEYMGHLEPILSDKIVPDPEVLARVAYWEEQSKVLINQVIGHTTADLTRNYFGESLLGNLTTDAVRLLAQVDCSFHQGGGLRADVEQGDITIGDIMNVNPFISETYIMEFTGANLLAILEQSASLTAGILQQSGIRMVIDMERDIGCRVVEATIKGEPIKPTQLYTVGASSFLVTGGDGFTSFMNAEKAWSTYVVERDFVIQHIKKLQHIEPALDGRTMIHNYAGGDL